MLGKFPFLIAERNGEIVGYAYAVPYNEREAYMWAAETTVYVRQDQIRRGIGPELYEALEKILSEQNIQSLYACIAYPTAEDEYLTRNSVGFHKHSGFRIVGEFNQCGYKFGRWYNVVWMEKHIAEHTAAPPAIKYFKEIRDVITEKYGIY